MAAGAWIVLGVVALVLAGTAFLAGRMSTRPAERSLRVTPLTHGSRDGEPAVSPDGRLVAFRALRPGGPGIWLMDVNTRSETRLTSGFDNLPRFSTSDAASSGSSTLPRPAATILNPPR